MVATDSATRLGSSVSSGPGLPVAIWQKSQRRVHWSPPIRNVASRSSQHSKMLGQPASSHTVCRPSRRTSCLSSVYSGPVRSLVLIHGGLRSMGTWLLRASSRSMRRPSGASTTSYSLLPAAACAILRAPATPRPGDMSGMPTLKVVQRNSSGWPQAFQSERSASRQARPRPQSDYRSVTAAQRGSGPRPSSLGRGDRFVMDTEHGPANRDGSTPRPEWSAPAQSAQAQSAQAQSAQALCGPPPPPPPPPYPGWAGYGWQPYQPGPASPGQPERPAPKRRALRLFAAGAAAAILAGGGAWAATGHGSGALSAETIAARTNPGLVDVISTLGSQRAAAEGTGRGLTPNGGGLSK